MFPRIVLFLLIIAPLLAGPRARTPHAGEPRVEWLNLAAGVDYAQVPLFGGQSLLDSLHAVRVDPRRAVLTALSAKDHGNRSRTAQQWCDEFGLRAVINAGMYDVDAKTHVGYMRTSASVNNKRWNKTYESVLLLEGTSAALPSAGLLDRSEIDETTLRSYGAVIQNLRLIRRPGVNVWQEQPRAWSEAAIAGDRDGNLLFLFLHKPLTMRQFNERLLRSGLHVVRAMHAEGGSEASLSVCSEAKRLHLSGSMETGLRADGGNMVQMPIPNVVGIKR